MAEGDSDGRPLLASGKRVSHFRIQQHIGRGGYGDIYTALDIDSSTLIAIKIEYLEAERQGLVDEIRVMSKLRGSAFRI
jgi:serine/threonine protein kinase